MAPSLKQETQGSASPEPADATEIKGFITRVSAFIRRPETITFGGVLALFGGLLWFGPEIVEKFKTIRETLHGFFAEGFEVPKPGEMKSWLVFMVVVIAAVVFVSLFYFPAMFWLARNLRRDRNTAIHDKTEIIHYNTEIEEKLRQTASERDRLAGASSQLEVEHSGLQLALAQTDEQLKQTASERNRISGEKSQLEIERTALQQALAVERDRVQVTLNARNNQLMRTIGGVVDAASRIRDQFFPAGVAGGGKNVDAVYLTYMISKNMDAEVRRRYVMRAGEAPLHFWQSKITVSSDAAPIESLADLNYRLISHDTGKDVVYLPTLNELHSKAVCTFFLPRVDPRTTRDFEAIYRWPGMFMPLKTQGWDKISLKVRNPEALKIFRLEVFLEPGSGGSLTCSEMGILLSNKTLEAVRSAEGWLGWRYSGTDIPAEDLENPISLKVEWNQA